MFTQEYKDNLEDLFIEFEDYSINIVEDEKIENLIKRVLYPIIMDANGFDFIINIICQISLKLMLFGLDYH